MRMAIRGDPPSPTSVAKEVSSVTMGPQTPTPARATLPISGKFPMYIRSTMLYSTLTSWASIVGTASPSTSRKTGPLPRSFSFFVS